MPKVEQPKAGYKADEKFEVLNEDDSILVLVDEAHRTQAGDLHANLLAGLPNCARIGFTGTPIIMGEKKRTHEIFGEFIDRYTIKEAEADGATYQFCTRAARPTARSRTGPAWTSYSRICFASTRPRNWRRSSKIRHQGPHFRRSSADR